MKKKKSRRTFLSNLGKSSFGIFLVSQVPTNLMGSIRSGWKSLIKENSGIDYIHLDGTEIVNQFKIAANDGGRKLKNLFQDIIGAIQGLPKDNKRTEEAQEAIATEGITTIVSISFAAGVYKAAAIASAGVIAASATPAIIGIAVVVVIFSIILVFARMASDRNVTIMVANLSKDSLKVDDIKLSENSGYKVYDTDSGPVEASPLNGVIPNAIKEEDGIATVFIFEKEKWSFDISGAIRMRSTDGNNYYIAWHCPQEGDNAVAVGLKDPKYDVSAADFRYEKITPGHAKQSDSARVTKGDKRYVIKAALSDLDSAFMQVLVTIEDRNVTQPPSNIKFTFRNKSTFPAYYARYVIRYYDENGQYQRWVSKDIPDGKSTEKRLHPDAKILSVNGRKLAGLDWKRIAKLDYKEVPAIKMKDICFESTGPVARAQFKAGSC